MQLDLDARAALHAALSDPSRLAIVDELVRSDRTPAELGRYVGVPSNLLAHHLGVLERVGLVSRAASAGDRRRRYVRLDQGRLAALGYSGPATRRPARVLFVCTHNSARSHLAAAAWRRHTGVRAESAGTHPAPRVHPGAVAAAARAGLDLAAAVPRPLTAAGRADLVVTVCDRANEELPALAHLHWSVADPVERGTAAAFDAALTELEARIRALTATFTPALPIPNSDTEVSA